MPVTEQFKSKNTIEPTMVAGEPEISTVKSAEEVVDSMVKAVGSWVSSITNQEEKKEDEPIAEPVAEEPIKPIADVEESETKSESDEEDKEAADVNEEEPAKEEKDVENDDEETGKEKRVQMADQGTVANHFDEVLPHGSSEVSVAPIAV